MRLQAHRQERCAPQPSANLAGVSLHRMSASVHWCRRQEQDVSSSPHSRNRLHIQSRLLPYRNATGHAQAIPPRDSGTHYQLMAERIPSALYVLPSPACWQTTLPPRNSHPLSHLPSSTGLPFPSASSEAQSPYATNSTTSGTQLQQHRVAEGISGEHRNPFPASFVPSNRTPLLEVPGRTSPADSQEGKSRLPGRPLSRYQRHQITRNVTKPCSVFCWSTIL